MARVLLHYDIADEDFRTRFQTAITAPTFNPRFAKETESVYVAKFNTTEDNPKATVATLKVATKNAPSDTKIRMEHPTAYSGRPEIEQTVIV